MAKFAVRACEVWLSTGAARREHLPDIIIYLQRIFGCSWEITEFLCSHFALTGAPSTPIKATTQPLGSAENSILIWERGCPRPLLHNALTCEFVEVRDGEKSKCKRHIYSPSSAQDYVVYLNNPAFFHFTTLNPSPNYS